MTRGLKLWLILASLLAAFALAGCGGDDDEDEPATSGAKGTPAEQAEFPTEPVKLTMWWWGEQEAKGAEDWLDETIRLYKQEHANVTIKPVLQTTDGLVPSFKAAAKAEKGPDIQYFWGGIWSLENAWADSIVPVSDYIPQDELQH